MIYRNRKVLYFPLFHPEDAGGVRLFTGEYKVDVCVSINAAKRRVREERLTVRRDIRRKRLTDLSLLDDFPVGGVCS